MNEKIIEVREPPGADLADDILVRLPTGEVVTISEYRATRVEVVRGGPGSGHFEHEGRHGEVGGSLPSGLSGYEIPESKRGLHVDKEGRLLGVVMPMNTIRGKGAGSLMGQSVFYKVRNRDEAVANLIPRIRNVTNEQNHVIASNGEAFAKMGGATKVPYYDSDLADIASVVGEDRNAISVHNHPPLFSGMDMPPSLSDFESQMHMNVKKMIVVTPRGQWDVELKSGDSAPSSVLTQDHIDTFMQYSREFNGVDDPKLSIPGYGDVGSTEDHLRRMMQDTSYAKTYSEWAIRRFEHVMDKMTEVFDYKWLPN